MDISTGLALTKLMGKMKRWKFYFRLSSATPAEANVKNKDDITLFQVAILNVVGNLIVNLRLSWSTGWRIERRFWKGMQRKAKLITSKSIFLVLLAPPQFHNLCRGLKSPSYLLCELDCNIISSSKTLICAYIGCELYPAFVQTLTCPKWNFSIGIDRICILWNTGRTIWWRISTFLVLKTATNANRFCLYYRQNGLCVNYFQVKTIFVQI